SPSARWSEERRIPLSGGIRRGDQRLDPGPRPRERPFGLPVVRSDAAEELGPASLRIDPADVLLLPNGSAVVALVVPEVEVPPTVEITDPGPATDFHFIPLSRGMPSRGEVRFQEGSMKLLPFASEILGPSTLTLELLRVELLQPRVRVDVRRPLVVPDADDPREAQREPARIVRAPLNLVVGDFHDHVRANMESPSFLRRREASESLGHRLELRIREAL